MLAKVLAAVTLALGASAHYTFPSIQSSGAWEYVRQADNYQSNGFVGDVSTPQMRCFQTAGSASKATYSVAAGSAVTYNAAPNVYHPGPMAFYLAKVPAGQTVDTFDGAGDVWFKIYHEQPNFGAQLTWPSNGKSSFSVNIPSCIPAGDYLLRAEHIGLHGASTEPSAKVAFPGAYKASDPGIQININYPVPTTYQNPGPAVFTC
ncbi:unnamed protein product [Parascedosporium putredinis]|uniref:lytic cellulose monooxygenase (C4-dehydrogenating) n=1 Tax=Parascedosporium putredinis TaxID=1442378 RepID=A0A9P1HAA8_9PEZI|nr:unnamed protein product [Parascedosporium putredinis]CAI8002470.1 unnamed protein product [Parascedosporium putredinis]